MSGRLENKVAVVTGGGNGIGRACCAGSGTVQLVEAAGGFYTD